MGDFYPNDSWRDSGFALAANAPEAQWTCSKMPWGVFPGKIYLEVQDT